MAYLGSSESKHYQGMYAIRKAYLGATQVIDDTVNGLLDFYGGANAAYSLRSLSAAWSSQDVVEVRRASDDTTRGFTSDDIGDGTLTNWVNATVALPLDTASGAAAAYSLRNLSTSYSGNVVDVRRSSDDTEASFTAAEVAGSTMVDWVGVGNDGHVTKWYDQSGNDNHAVQATPASQPKIVEGGTLVTDGLKFDGGQFMTTTDYAVSLSQNSASVFSVTNATSGGYILTEADVAGSSSNFIYGGAALGETLWVNSTSFGSSFSTTKAVNGFDFDGTNFQTYENGAENGTSGTATVNAEVNGFTGIGADAWADTPVSFYTGTMAEIICYKSDQTDNRKAIESNMADYHGNIELPAGFDSGNNEVDGFVATWYDQSGNGNNATQPVSTSQPKIVEGGVLVADGLKFDNTDDYLDSVNQVLFGTGSRSIFATCAPDSIGANADGIVQLSQATGSTGEGWLLTPEVATRTNTTTWISSSPATLSQANLISNIYTSGSLHAGNSMFLNGASVSQTSGTDGTINTATSEIRIGAGRDATAPFDGTISEIIIYDSDQSDVRLGIEKEINDVYNIY